MRPTRTASQVPVIQDQISDRSKEYHIVALPSEEQLDGKSSPSPEAIKAVLDTYSKLEPQLRSSIAPGFNLIKITNNFARYIINQIRIIHGPINLSHRLVNLSDLDTAILLHHEENSELQAKYKTALEEIKTALITELNETVAEISTILSLKSNQ